MKILKWVISFVLIVALAFAANRLSKLHAAVEFPIWAAILGIIAGNIPKVSDWFKNAIHTELFIKIGLVLLGASISFGVIMSVGARGLIQALVGVPLVFFSAWYIGKWFGLEDKMRAVLSTAVSICGVSAAIAASGAVLAKKENLTYIITLVILFALPLMVLVPFLARTMNLPASVAGAWIGNNIDTTAAVVGSAQIYGGSAVKVASVVKMSQNTLIGVAAFLLALYFAVKVEKGRDKPKAIEIWNRFPKFVLAFLVVSLLATFAVFDKEQIKMMGIFQKWFFDLAFVCIGLSFSLKEMKQVGGKPLGVFAIVTVINTLTALGLSYLLFSNYEV